MKQINSWQDVTTRQYIELFNLAPIEDDFDFLIKQISILYGLSENEVENLSLPEFKRIHSEIVDLISTEPEQIHFKKEIVISGDTYTFRESLSNFTIGEWADIEAFQLDLKSNLHKVMGIFYRKNGITRYDSAICDETAERFLDVDIETVLAAFFLFHLYAQNFIQSDIAGCSMMDLMEMEMKKTLKALKKEQSVGKKKKLKQKQSNN